ncbi:MAG: sulfotransferase [Pseudomonadota bacterium]
MVLPPLWASGALRRPVFDTDALLARARAKTGLSDFGDRWFEQPLLVLARALQKEANLNALGRFAAYGQLIKLLRDRLWTQHWLSAYPEILAQPLPPPVVVIGPMRSGTTRLHRLLAADTRFAHLRFFETVSPVPPPDLRGRPVYAEQADPRLIEARRILRAVRAANPATARIHPSAPLAPEEELGLLVASAWGMKHDAQWNVPSYSQWCARQNPLPAYRHLVTLLRLVSWLRGDDGARPWVLKSPQHMLDLPALLGVFPQARLIFIHRDPARVVGSACSLSWNQTIIHSDVTDPQAMGQKWLRQTGQQIERMQRARKSLAHGQALDVRYADMETDWSAVLHRIYDFLGEDIAPALPAMEAYVARSEALGHARQHCYDLASFGLGPRQVREHFAAYIDAYAIPVDEPIHTGRPEMTAIGRGARPIRPAVLPSGSLPGTG